MTTEDREFWFRAKRYGWGWTPITWKGWLATGTHLALVVVAAALLSRHMISQATFFACVALLTALLLAVCWLTGEKPSWRWGGK